ncbi:MAG TPA: helix-turn-helix domain-containing protein [Azospirillaceae bacterium]|nr:helix-turn-helix domain-containing protein [Azospirillaceae bacterium]
MPESPRPLRTIAVLAFDGVQSLDVVGPMEVFAVANRFADPHRPAYEVLLATPDGRPVRANAGLQLGGGTALSALPPDVDTIVVTGGDEASMRHAVLETDLVPWLQDRTHTTRRIASVCSGALILAAAGFLDGRRATTHWNLLETMRQLRPAVRLEPDAIYVAEPPFYTSAGVSAGIDLSLAFVEADCGAATALQVAKELVLFLRRPGGQSQFSAGLAAQASATPRLRDLLTAIMENPTGNLSLPALAGRVGMTERTFTRTFRSQTGTTPARFVEAARIDRAKTLLETSTWPLARVAERAGFGSPDALHRSFLKRLGVTPGDYRERFGPRGP